MTNKIKKTRPSKSIFFILLAKTIIMTLEEVKKLIGIREDQIWLLKAALFAPEEAITYWECWKTHKNLNHITKEDANYSIFSGVDTESLRVLPLIYRNLEHSADPLLPALRDAYRDTWMSNQKLLYRAQEIVRACNEAGIPNMLLKGIPMSLHYYKDMGVRPMGDIDLLVPLEYLEATISLLTVYGNTPDAVEYKYRHLIHAMHCFDEGGVDVDLHWNLHYFQIDEKTNKSNWEKSTIIYLDKDLKSQMLCPEYQLFFTIVHGFKWGNHPSVLRWVLDCYTMAKTFRIDKNNFLSIIKQATDSNMSLALKTALIFLRDEFQVSSLKELEIDDLLEPTNEYLYLKIAQLEIRGILGQGIQMIIKNFFIYYFFLRHSSKQNLVMWMWDKAKFRYAMHGLQTKIGHSQLDLINNRGVSQL